MKTEELDVYHDIVIKDAEMDEGLSFSGALYVEDNKHPSMKSVHIGIVENTGWAKQDSSMALDKEGAVELIQYLNKFFQLGEEHETS